MACIGFDLDETLGRFGVVFYHLATLTPHESLYEESWGGKYGVNRIEPPIPFSDSLKEKCKVGFELFCQCIAEKERANLGLIRPEMIEIAKRLYSYKQMTPPMVKSVVIYSNNGNMASLRLAARVIEILADTPGLFCNFINWFHPLRQHEIQHGRPGSALKTLNILLKAFQQGGCSAEDIDIKNVYFFDDLVHPNIATAIGDNYFHIPPYKVDANPADIDECFLSAFKTAGLDTDQEYWSYIAPLGIKNLSELMHFLQANQIKVLKKNRPNNATFRSRFQGRFPHSSVPRHSFTKALSTLRKLERKQNQGSPLSANEQRALNVSRNRVTEYESQNPNTQGGRRSLKTRRQGQRRASKN